MFDEKLFMLRVIVEILINIVIYSLYFIEIKIKKVIWKKKKKVE